MASIYEIGTEFATIWQLMEDGTLDDETLAEVFENAKDDLADKLEGYCKFIKNLESDIDGLKAEETRLKARRQTMENTVKRAKEAMKVAMAKAILRANILLASDRNNKKQMTVTEIAETYHTTPTTVQTVRTSYVNNGLEATVTRKKRESPPVPPKVTGDVEAHIIALACSDPPEGYSKWTLRLLAEKCVELNYAESLSHMTVSRILKKTKSSLI